MKKSIILLSLVTFLTISAVVIAPATAIGPSQAAAVGNNPNLITQGPIVMNIKGEGDGSNTWHWAAMGHYWGRMKWLSASQAEGLINNAIVAVKPEGMSITAYIAVLGSRDYDSQWIYLGSDDISNPNQYAYPIGPFAQYGPHGMWWWITFMGAGANTAAEQIATLTVSLDPDGTFFMHNDIPATGP